MASATQPKRRHWSCSLLSRPVVLPSSSSGVRAASSEPSTSASGVLGRIRLRLPRTPDAQPPRPRSRLPAAIHDRHSSWPLVHQRRPPCASPDEGDERAIGDVRAAITNIIRSGGGGSGSTLSSPCHCPPRHLSVEWSLTFVALALIAVAAISKRISGTPITPAILFVAFGLLVGPEVLGGIDLSRTGSTVRALAEATLVLVLFADASRIDFAAAAARASPPRAPPCRAPPEPAMPDAWATTGSRDEVADLRRRKPSAHE